MFSKIHNRKGFTLIELMIVVVIIGILASLAIPRFMQATTKAKQSEAKGLLKQIYTMERTERQANGEYLACAADDADDFRALGIELPEGAKYSYVVTCADPEQDFTAEATWDIDGDGNTDTWQMTETGELWCAYDDVTDTDNGDYVRP